MERLFRKGDKFRLHNNPYAQWTMGKIIFNKKLLEDTGYVAYVEVFNYIGDKNLILYTDVQDNIRNRNWVKDELYW